MNKRFKGFTIAELLIALLIISIVLAAAIPTITKRGKGSESIWQWAETKNSTYFSNVRSGSVIIGNTYIPIGGVLNNPDNDTKSDIAQFTNQNDKLILVKTTAGVKDSAHISFYNVNQGTTTEAVKYSGRLTLDSSNIGLGMGVLEKLDPMSCSGTTCTSTGNIAIGQYASALNKTGNYNTAIGTKALSKNTQSSYNTMLGYKAGVITNITDINKGMNTGIGSFSMMDNTTGDANTAIGYMTLQGNSSGRINTALGAGACSSIGQTKENAIPMGNANLCLGFNAGSSVFSKNPTTDITNYRSRYSITNENNKKDYLLFIGSDKIPLIGGRMNSINNNLQRNVNFNTNDFDVNTPFIKNVLNIKASEDTTNDKVYGTFSFVPYREGTTEPTTLQISGSGSNVVNVNSVVKNGANNYLQTLGLNNGTVLIIPENNKTVPSSKLSIYTDTNTAHIYTDNLEKNKDLPHKSLIFNEDRLVIHSNGNTKISNGTDANYAGKSYIHISKDNNISLRAHNGGNLIIESKNLFLKDDNAVFDVPETHKQANVFDNKVNFNGIIEGEVHIQSLPKKTKVYNMNGDFVDKQTTDNIALHIYDIWGALQGLATAIQHLRDQVMMVASDARLKNIQGENVAGLKEINALKVKNYTYKNDEKKTPHVGVIAQELREVFPNSVFEGEDGYLRIRTEEIFYAMVNSIKELCTQIKDLTAKVTGLDNRIKKLEQENAQLKKQNAEFEKRLKKLEAKVK